MDISNEKASGVLGDIAHDEDIDSNQHLADEVSYGPKGMRGLISSPFVVGACFLASMGGFSFGYDQGVISILNTMDQFHTSIPGTESPFGKGLMTGMLELGAFVATLMFPYLADKISRKRALSVVVVIFNIGAILQTAAVNYGMLVAGRFIGGMGVGTLALVSSVIDLAADMSSTNLEDRVRPSTSPRSHLQTFVAHSSFSSPSLSSPESSSHSGLRTAQKTWPATFVSAYHWDSR